MARGRPTKREVEKLRKELLGKMTLAKLRDDDGEILVEAGVRLTPGVLASIPVNHWPRLLLQSVDEKLWSEDPARAMALAKRTKRKSREASHKLTYVFSVNPNGRIKMYGVFPKSRRSDAWSRSDEVSHEERELWTGETASYDKDGDRILIASRDSLAELERDVKAGMFRPDPEELMSWSPPKRSRSVRSRIDVDEGPRFVMPPGTRRHRKPNPKPFADRPHDWNEVLISRNGKRLTRKQIRDHYVRNRDKIWPFLKGQTVAIIFAPKRNEFVRRRNGPDGKPIKLTKLEGIDDPRSFEYWINRRVIEFHPVLTTKTAKVLWLDLDMHKTTRKDARKKLLAKMKRAVPKLEKAFKKMGVDEVFVFQSGTGGGIHLGGNFKSRRNIDSARKKFRAILDEMFDGDPVFTTGRAKSGQIRLDTTTYHYLGSLRAPYSMTVSGGVKKPIGRRR